MSWPLLLSVDGPALLAPWKLLVSLRIQGGGNKSHGREGKVVAYLFSSLLCSSLIAGGDGGLGDFRGWSFYGVGILAAEHDRCDEPGVAAFDA